jgi:hypothetical protein
MYKNKAEKLYDLYLFYQIAVSGDLPFSISGCPFAAIEGCVDSCGLFFPDCIRDSSLDSCECPCHYYGEEVALAKLKDVLLEAGYFI